MNFRSFDYLSMNVIRLGEVDDLNISMSFEIPSDVMVTGGIEVKFSFGKVMLFSAGSSVKTEMK